MYSLCLLLFSYTCHIACLAFLEVCLSFTPLRLYIPSSSYLTMSHRFRQPIFSFGNQPQASEPYAGGSQTTNSIFDLDSSLAAPSSPPPLPPSSNPPSTSRDSLLAKDDQSKWPDWPDYSVWTPELYKHFPNYTSAHNQSKESAWWWRFGYRLRTTEYPKLPWKMVWICHRCVTQRLLPRYSSFVFVASTGKSITRHLLSVHRQCVCHYSLSPLLVIANEV